MNLKVPLYQYHPRLTPVCHPRLTHPSFLQKMIGYVDLGSIGKCSYLSLWIPAFAGMTSVENLNWILQVR